MSDKRVLSERASEAGGEKTPNREILVVDDEPCVVNGVSQALGRLGCTVGAVSNLEETLRMIGEKSYDVILPGIETPWLRGDALYREIERWRPSLSERVAFISTNIGNPEISAFLERAGRPYLWKPFSIRDLQDVVVKVMQGKE